MTTLNVKEMSCNHCVERIGKALSQAGIKHSIDLDAKTVTIDGCENCVRTAISELDDIGFTATVAQNLYFGQSGVQKLKKDYFLLWEIVYNYIRREDLRQQDGWGKDYEGFPVLIAAPVN